MRRNGAAVKEEVAVWDRSGLEVGAERLQTTTRVTLEWPADGEKIVCDEDGMGDNPWADDVVRALQNGAVPRASRPATGGAAAARS
jgi:hypothetical protein